MPFLNPYVRVDIDDAAGGLVQPLIYQGRDDMFTVPAGFVTDFASVPRFMTWLIPTMGAYTRAAVLHDWLCTDLERGKAISPRYITLANARDTDGIFRRVCRESGTPLVRRWLLWAGVRWGALGTPARRPDWLRDAPAVVGISLLALPLLLLPALFVGLALLIDRAVEVAR